MSQNPSPAREAEAEILTQGFALGTQDELRQILRIVVCSDGR
jgi:hypothetical protein